MTKMIELLNPTADVVRTELKLAPRPADLNGKRFGLLDNGKPNFNIFLSRVEERLSQRFRFADVVRAHKGAIGAATAFPAAQLEQFAAGCDVVVNGMSDWGACTSWSVHDSIELEKRGIATVTICSDLFVPLAKSVSATKGLPELALVVIPHPLGGIKTEAVHSRSDQVIDQIVQLLTDSRDRVTAGRGHS